MRPALHTHSLPLIMLAAALTMAACQETENTPDAAFGAPIDFAFACEGQGRTFQPTVTDDADDQALCDDPADDLVRAHLLGLVLNRDPAQVHVLQLNNDRRAVPDSGRC